MFELNGKNQYLKETLGPTLMSLLGRDMARSR